MRTTIATMTLATALSLAAAHAWQAALTQYPLPAEVTYPEGIAYDPSSGQLFTGSAATGAIVRLDAKAAGKGGGTVIAKDVLPGDPFPGVLGMTVDRAGRLWIAGGRSGRMVVLDARSGKELKRFDTSAEPGGLINDVVVAGSSAYFTDTFRPVLWRVAVKGSEIGEVEPWLRFEKTPLQYGEGPNINGIAATADGRHLIVVQMNKGLLFRIGVEDKQVTPIDVGGEALNTGDGLVLDGTTLYVVRQGEQEIVTLQLSGDLSKGKVVSRFKDPALMWPATAEKVGNELLVVNTQFNKRATKDAVTPFSIVGVPLSRLGGK